jgi:diaminopimelate epimerase
MKFAKYHGIGNDFILIADPHDDLVLDAERVRQLCDRRFGIGGDGVIRVAPGGEDTHLFMDYVNSDGSVGEMCGNGIRCLALFAQAEGLVTESELRIGTRAGTKSVWIRDYRFVTVDMGAPIFDPPSIPVDWPEPDALHAKADLEDQVVEVACLSIGNPHAVIFTEELESAPVSSLGPVLETHSIFPNGTNVEFVRPVTSRRIEMRVWERGSGQTLACGTGACAAAVASRVLRGTENQVVVGLPGGDLDIDWRGSTISESPILMTGPAVKAFEGEVDLS